MRAGEDDHTLDWVPYSGKGKGIVRRNKLGPPMLISLVYLARHGGVVVIALLRRMRSYDTQRAVLMTMRRSRVCWCIHRVAGSSKEARERRWGLTGGESEAHVCPHTKTAYVRGERNGRAKQEQDEHSCVARPHADLGVTLGRGHDTSSLQPVRSRYPVRRRRFLQWECSRPFD